MHLILTHEQADFDGTAALLAARSAAAASKSACSCVRIRCMAAPTAAPLAGASPRRALYIRARGRPLTAARRSAGGLGHQEIAAEPGQVHLEEAVGNSGHAASECGLELEALA